ncbi:hypothetical protein [Rubrivirga sp. IMCC45206]|uniref:hypothetical protein n=1 Tax=Rubrivirga sp. IMCC45206 TaxID=3391614 RepID=UPI0039901A17
MRLVPFKRSFVEPSARLKRERPTAWAERDGVPPAVAPGARERARQRLGAGPPRPRVETSRDRVGLAVVIGALALVAALAVAFATA